MNTKNYCYPFASGVYKAKFESLKYGYIPGVKIEDLQKFEEWVRNEIVDAEKCIIDYSNKINNY